MRKVVSRPCISVKSGAAIECGNAFAQENVVRAAEYDRRVFPAGQVVGKADARETEYVFFDVARQPRGAVRFDPSAPAAVNQLAHARAGKRGARSK